MVVIPSPRVSHALAIALLLMLSASVLRSEGAVNAHRSQGPYDNLFLNSVDAGLRGMLPEPAYHVAARVMHVFASPADMINNARDHVGLTAAEEKGNAAAGKINSILDGITWVAVVGTSVVGVLLRILVMAVRGNRRGQSAHSAKVYGHFRGHPKRPPVAHEPLISFSQSHSKPPRARKRRRR